MKGNSQMVMVRMPQELKDEVEREAEKTGLSQADIIRLALKEYLKKPHAEK